MSFSRNSPPAHNNRHSARSTSQPNVDKWSVAAESIQQDFQGGSSWKDVDNEPEDYNSSDWLSRKTKKVQMDSLDTSQRALSRINEAQLLAQSNLSKLSVQTDQLHGIDRRLQDTEQHVKISEAKSDRLKALNRFFMVPAFGSKSAKRREEELQKQIIEQDQQRMQNALYEQESQERRQRIQSNIIQPQRVSHRSSSVQGTSGHLYSTPHGLERDATEVQIDSNLNQISSGLQRLKMMGQSMNDELNSQKTQLNRLQDRTDENRDRMQQLNRNMDRLANKRR